MVRAIIYFFVAMIVLGTILTPGLGAFALVLAPFLGVGLLWRAALTASTRGRSVDAVVYTKRRRLLGPGGPDDSFAASPFEEEAYPTEAPARLAVSPNNGRVRGANVPRRGFSEVLPVRPRGENSIQGVGG